MMHQRRIQKRLLEEGKRSDLSICMLIVVSLKNALIFVL